MTGSRHRKPGLFVVAAPSGAGKTSLVHALLNRVANLRFSTSYTTRPKRTSETHGQDYFFVDRAQFERMVARGEFLEHAEVFDNCYGTGARHVNELLDAGSAVLLEIDWQGARQVRQTAPEAVSIFILPPSVQELERRLRARATDTEAVIDRRLADAVSDMGHWDEFDYVVVNDVFDDALDALDAILAGRGESFATSRADVRAAVTRIIHG